MIQVNTLITTNRYLLEDMRTCRVTTEQKVAEFEGRAVKQIDADKKAINSQIFNARLINKKISDNTASICSLLSITSPDEEYFASTSNTFLRSASMSDTAQPAQAVSGATIAFDVYIINRGMYYSWIADKAVTLTLDLYAGTGDLIQSYTYELNTIINVPGEETSNGDYGAEKIWSITGLVLPVLTDPDMIFRYSLSDTFGGITNNYNFSFSAPIELLAS